MPTATLVPQARDALAAELAERGRSAILLIDEGHLLTHDGLEALRLLTLCRDSDYAGICMNSPIPQSVPGQRSRHNLIDFRE